MKKAAKKRENTKKVHPKTYARTPRGLQLRFLDWLSGFNARLTDRQQSFLIRRPHRSFRRTYRRDYVRRLRIPGYVAFTHEVNRMLLQYRRVFIGLAIVYALTIAFVGGLTNQEVYGQISTLMKESGQELMKGGVGKISQAGILLAATVFGGGSDLSADQQIYLGLALMMVWLATVWLLREFMLGRKPTLRDGLYNSAAPLVSTLVVVFVLAIQLLPAGVVALAYAGLVSVGLATEGFGAMIFWVTAVLVAVLSLYWITSTLIAMVVVTLPGMYPFRALKAASDLVVGRRLRILYRWLWAVLVVVVSWLVIMVPTILLDSWLKDTWKQLDAIPIVPVGVAFLSAVTMVWFAAYVYLLYRKVVDDDAKPA